MKSVMTLLALFVLTMTPGVLPAQEAANAKKKASAENQAKQFVNQFMKQLADAELTETQTTEIKEHISKVALDAMKKRIEAEITPAMMKQRNDAGKAAREAGKKPKEVKEAIANAVPLSDKQKETLEETEAAIAKAKIEIGKKLEPSQLAKLSKPFASGFSEKKTKSE